MRSRKGFRGPQGKLNPTNTRKSPGQLGRFLHPLGCNVDLVVGPTRVAQLGVRGARRSGAAIRPRILTAALVAGAVFLWTSAACAQVDASTPETARLAAEFNDPLTTLPQLFLQDAYTPSNYGTDAPLNRVIFRVIVPRVPRISLMPDQLIRPSFQLVTVPTGKGSDTRTEFGDMQLFDFGVIPWPGRETGLLMGVGPVFVFPTATHRLAGQRAWQVGPGFATIYKGIPGLVLGGLIQNPISFAYTSDDSVPVSTFVFQPIVLAHVGQGFYVKSADASWTVNWRRRTPTLIPVSFGIGHVTVREGLPPINVFVTGEWMAYRQFAPVAAQTTVRFGLTMAFPQWRLWD